MIWRFLSLLGLVYALLFVLWITVLHSKIQKGPDAVGPEPDVTTGRAVLEAGARRVGHRDSLTEAKDAS